MLKRHLPISVHRHDRNTFARLLPASDAAVRLVADTAVEQRISSIHLAEALGISQPTAWRMGDALRLMPGREQVLDGVGGNDGLDMRSKPQRVPNYVSLGRRCKGHPKTLKTAALVAVPRPPDQSVGASAGETRAVMIEDLSEFEADRVLTEPVDRSGHLMSDA